MNCIDYRLSQFEILISGGFFAYIAAWLKQFEGVVTCGEVVFFSSLLKLGKVRLLPLKENSVNFTLLLHDIDEMHFQFSD